MLCSHLRCCGHGGLSGRCVLLHDAGKSLCQAISVQGSVALVSFVFFGFRELLCSSVFEELQQSGKTL